MQESNFDHGVLTSEQSPRPDSLTVDEIGENFDNSKKLKTINDILGKFDLDDFKEEELRVFLNSQQIDNLKDYLAKLIAGSSESSKIKDLTKNQDFVKSFIDNFEQIYNSISSVNPIKKLEIRIAELKSKSNLSLVDLDELDNLKEKLRLLKNENISNLKKAESRIVVNSYKNLDTIKTITNIKNSIPAKVLSSHSDIDNLLIQADGIIKNDDLSGEERNNKLKEIQNKILELLKNPLKLKKLADELKEEGGNIYQEFKTSIIKIAPELQEKFDEYESGSVDTKAKLKLGTDNLKGVDLSKNVLTKTEDGFTTEAGNDTRKISIQGNDYKFDATLQNEDELEELDYLEGDLKSQLKPLNALIVSALNIIGYIDDAILKNIDIKEIKDTIKSEFPELYSELHLENIDSLAQLKQAFVSFLKEKEEEKEEKIKEFKKKINLLIQKNKKAASEKDEKVKAILSFLNKIGFDLLPQSATDWLIAQINAKSQAYGLDKPIDLINGELGFNSFGEKPEVKFTTLFSKILGLKGEDELDYYKIQRNFYGLKLEKNKPGIDGLRVYIDTEFKVNGVFKEDKLLKNLNAK